MKRTQVESEELAQRFQAQLAAKDEPQKDDAPGEATERSSPVTLDQTYQIRFDRQDIKDLEFALSAVYRREVGYSEFIRPEIFNSWTAMELYLWRGLRELTRSGQLVHVFDANIAGSEEAGDLLWSFIQNGGNMRLLQDQIGEGFVACRIARKVNLAAAVDNTSPKDGDAPKNSPT